MAWLHSLHTDRQTGGWFKANNHECGERIYLSAGWAAGVGWLGGWCLPEVSACHWPADGPLD